MSSEINYDQCYQTLNLRPGASLAEIKQRYRELARRFHPDKVPPAQRERATLQFQRINEAKEVLEAYWEEQRSAPPSALHQRFQEALRRREEEQRQRTEAAWRPRTEPPRPPQHQRPATPKTPYEPTEQKRHTSREPSSVSFLARVFIVLIAETSIFLILWFGYHSLSDLHTALVRLQVYTANDLMLKVSFGLASSGAAGVWLRDRYCVDSASVLAARRSPRTYPAHAFWSTKATSQPLPSPLSAIFGSTQVERGREPNFEL